ncbi:hypothetical protein J7E73_30930 [Paenibacillus albidus]|uniref:hypothetical protein n=1 Tax=Paenibacillus albidus TaxID=2041023 RepID=UPI001BE92EB5|nr:hypothetical protein [Paenibacillus albidus]MBT2293430.1 hypothetical protein [Paenibacillus albidus]
MANEILVPADFPTIAAAIVAANEFDTIRVAPGVYNETIIVNKTIQLHGAQSGVDARTRFPLAESAITSNNAGITATDAVHISIWPRDIGGNLLPTQRIVTSELQQISMLTPIS